MTRKLPVGTCIRHAINSVRNNLRYAFRITWPWWAVLAVIFMTVFGLAGFLSVTNPDSVIIFAIPAGLIAVLVFLLAFSSIAVNWHRYILLDEVPRGTGLLRVDATVWRYMGNVVLIALILLATMLVILLPLIGLSKIIGFEGILTFLGILVVIPLAMILSSRLSVKLPAIAIERRDFFIKDAWEATRGNSGAIFLVALFQFAIAIGLSFLLFFIEMIFTGIDATLGAVVSGLLQLGMNWILTIFGITILTSLYGFFVEGRDF